MRSWLELLERGYGAGLDPGALGAGLLLFLIATAAFLLLVRDAGWDRHAPTALLLAAAVASLLPLPSWEQAPDAAAALRRCASALASRLGQGEELALPAGACPPSLWRDRLLRELPLDLQVERDAAGPIERLPDGAAPGTLLVALAPGARLGWVSAVGLGREGPALLREGERIWIAGFVAGREGW